MGLDMYLYGVTYSIDKETGYRKRIIEEVAYWRKQNAIHNWMVKNVQKSVDNCAMYYVSETQIKQLLVQCKKVLENPTVENAMKHLPTKSGFFYGGTDLTDDFEMEYYIDGLKYTVKTLRSFINSDIYEGYYYQSSW